MAGCRAVIVENERSALERCAEVVRRHPGIDLIATAESYHEGLSIIRARGDQLDLLLTDLQLGDGNGTDLISAWRALPEREGDPRRSMVISVFGDVDSVVRAVEAGADGYLLKGGSDDEMTSSLTTVLEGGAPISAAVAGHLLRRVRKTRTVATEPSAPATQLSDREVQVLKRLARGQSYKEVARDMGLSPYTIGDHVKRIYQKLAVGSRGEAVYEAIRGGLIDLSD